MKLKWNWGTGIFLVIVLFIGTVFWRIWLANQRDINLVSEDYYPKGVNFQDEINYRRNFDSLGITLPIRQAKDSVYVDFSMFSLPIVSADIHFYRPSSSKFDKHFQPDSGFSGIYGINSQGFIKGRYVVKIHLESLTRKYYYETNFKYQP